MKKAIVFNKTFDEQRNNSLEYTKSLSYLERLEECLRLTRKAFWSFYKKGNPPIKKTMQIYKGLKGEDVNDFYKRIRQ